MSRPLHIELPEDESLVVWRPPTDCSATHIERWRAWLEEHRGLRFGDYEQMWAWSVGDLQGFWSSIADYFNLGIDTGEGQEVLHGTGVETATWFPRARLNYAEQLLQRAPQTDVAVVALSTARGRISLTGEDLRDQVGRAARGLKAQGVVRGDRVAAYLPNIPEALVLMLASASLGAIYTSCPPEFGSRAVLDRLQQIEPKVLVSVDGYRHKGREIDRTLQLAEISAGLPSLTETIVLPYLRADASTPGIRSWAEFMSGVSGPIEFEPLPFDHPLYILYSSGTTGRPKPIVHRHGGILLEHVKLHHLHHDLHPGDRFFWFTTTGWVMWNYLMSGLLTGASIVMFDGDPAYPSLSMLWDLAESEQVTVFGASAPYYLACRSGASDPTNGIDLSSIRQIGSTGAPLPVDGYFWLHEHVSATSPIISASGGTDVCTAFVAGTPLHPVVAGEITCRCLGVKVEAFDPDGAPVIGVDAEMVITAPMPSMPIGFWGDTEGRRYHDAYFERYPGVWTQGDFVRITTRGSCVISGRSDATLNRGGVRLGTSDFYSVIQTIAGIDDSLVVHLEDPDGGAGRLFLFLQLSEGVDLDDELLNTVRLSLKSQLSPRHIPDEVLAVPFVPRTLTGKKLEIPVKRLLLGDALSAVASADSLQVPESLQYFESLGASLKP